MEVGKSDNCTEVHNEQSQQMVACVLGDEYTYQQLEVATVVTGRTEAGFARSRPRQM